MKGRMIAVVGPSGVGKDSVMAGLAAARPGLFKVKRVVTRDPDAGGEEIEAISPALFAARAAGGDFLLHWEAHGLHYGIPRGVLDWLDHGQDGLVNLSRTVLAKAGRVFPTLHVLHVTARPEVLEERLRARGRESRADIAKRLSRKVPPLPSGLAVTEIDNSGSLDASVGQALSVLYPERV